jgi:hypothetical protein
MNVTLQLFLAQQANMQPPHVLPSILNPGSEDPHTTPVPKTPHEQISKTGDTQHIKASCLNEFGYRITMYCSGNVKIWTG